METMGAAWRRYFRAASLSSEDPEAAGRIPISLFTGIHDEAGAALLLARQ